jgi:hypothetical protein
MSDESQGGEPIKPIKKDEDANNVKGQANPENTPNPPPPTVGSAVVFQVNPRPPENATPKKHKNKRCKKLHFHFKKRKDTYECFGVLAAIVIAVAALWQIGEMQKDRNLDERAWVGVQDVRLALPYSAENVGLHVTIINTGRTPATIFNERISVVTATVHGNSTNNDTLGDEPRPKFVAAPGQAYPFFISKPLRSGKKDFNLLVEKKMQVKFYLTIYYWDVFNIPRITQVGYIITGRQDDVRGEGSIIQPIPDFGRMN